MGTVLDVLDVHEIAHAVDPSVYERTRRVQYAMLLMRSGVCRHRIARMIADRYGIHRSTAWRTAQIAMDLAGPIER